MIFFVRALFYILKTHHLGPATLNYMAGRMLEMDKKGERRKGYIL